MPHPWTFVRVGGFDQVRIRSGADLAAIPDLDQKLWTALACPTKGLELDERTLALIDTDHDGRIRAGELIAAIDWAVEMVSDPDDLTKGSSALELDAIDDDSEEGALLLATAKTLLASLGKADAESISVEDTTKALEAFAKQARNGDGVVPEAAGSDDATKALIRDVLACTAAPEKDRGGEPGVTAAALKTFFDEITAHAKWLEDGKAAAARPLGDDTAAAYAALVAVRAKIDDYFARTDIAAYDPRALAALNGEEKQYLELCAKDLTLSSAELERLPIAQVAADRPLPLDKGVSPAWAEKIAAFRERVVVPAIGARSTLTRADWAAIALKLAPHDAWAKAKAGTSVEKLGAERVRELASGGARTMLEALITADVALAPQAKAIESVEKLVRLNRDLMTLVNNFVTFRDFYGRSGPATFQVGTLYIDRRACELCVRVVDPAKHAAMAPLSNNYLLYADLKNSKGETMQIAAAMTAGDVDNLMVGRNGIFYDRRGVDWDATVTKIIDNPISVRQAFWSPYKKVIRAIEERIAKRAADEAAASDAALGSAVEAAPGAATSGAPPPAPTSRPIDVGTVAALGVAVGGITAAIGALLGAVFGLGLWMPLGILGLLLCISGPSMAVAALKLRRRNLGPLLDANGWAVNAQAVVNVPLGGSLTKEAELPEGSSRDLRDPFEQPRRPWGLYATVIVILVIALGWYIGRLDGYLPVAARSTTLLGADAPAAVPVTPLVEPVPAPVPAADP